MRDLLLHFADGQITGAGHDIIGAFTFTGKLNEQGGVVMVKQYIGMHAVNYLGQCDGEGLLWGHWYIGPLTDRWMIKIARPTSTGDEVHELAAPAA